ncbi:MAG: shikimate dehydrogenase [Deltaproteobacteria bacterium]|nr:shikimate dehydrogenase [Deltaproteobacteria bacterium]
MREVRQEVFALFGNPVGHSLSPLMHNAAFSREGLNACYVPFCVENLNIAVQAIRALNIRGVSVTIPFKVDVMKHLDAVDEDALRIGAVNTIMNDGGRLRGANTDWKGLILALKEATAIRDKTFVILGAGGTARAAVFGILSEGGIPLVVNRSAEKGRLLAAEWRCVFHPWQRLGEIKADCLINTTPVGMAPETGLSPIQPDVLKNFKLVMDVIYNPLRTKLLQDAQKAGCVVLSGVSMFVHQGAEQIRLWTGQEPPRPFMSEIVRQALEG